MAKVYINWIGPERIIPNFGKVTAGESIALPENKADSFVKQGLAEYRDLSDEIEMNLSVEENDNA